MDDRLHSATAPDTNFFQNQLVSDNSAMRAMIESSPLALNFWDRNHEIIACNARVLHLFDTIDFKDFKDNFFDFSPEYQPDGRKSMEKASALLEEAFTGRQISTLWRHQTRGGDVIPVEVYFTRIPFMNDYVVASYTRDIRQQKEMEDRIRKFNTRLKAILDATPLCLNLWNTRFENIMCNKEAVFLFDLENEQDYVDKFFELSPEYQPDGRLSSEKAMEKIKDAFKNGRCQFFWNHCNLKGEEIPAEITLVRIDELDENGENLVAGYTRDLRKQVEAQKIQESANQRILAMLDSMPLACILWTSNETIMYCNQIAVNIFCAKDKQDIIENFNRFIPEVQPDGMNSIEKKAIKFEEVFRDGSSIFEWVYKSSSGEEIPCEVTLVKITAEQDDMVVAYSRDLRELHQTLSLNDRLARLAYYDPLTGCASRARFLELMEESFNNSTPDSMALMIYDIDYFKSVNDTYGHEAGDMVLKRVTKCIEKLIPKNALLGRFGGDEFMVLLDGFSRDEIVDFMKEYTQSISNLTFRHEGLTFTVTISIGSGFKSGSDRNYHDLLKRADKALYSAKDQGRNCGVLL